MTMSRKLERAGLCGLALAVWSATAAMPATAQSDADFFRGKTITMGTPSDPGGGFSTYVRLFARHFHKHVPGTPNVVAQNVPGGGGLVQANRLFNTEPKDEPRSGPSWSASRRCLEGVFGNPAAKFDGRKFAWLGNLNADRDTCIFWHTTGINSPKDFYGKEVLVGATGVGATTRSTV